MKLFHTTIGNDLYKAAALLRQQELVAIPTETVYGLAANAYAQGAILKVFQTKQRPATNPLIVHTHSIDVIRQLVTHIPSTAIALLEAFAPGPLTVLLPKNAVLPAVVNAGRREVAFRLPAHPLCRALLQQLSFPLVAPSANLFGTVSPTEPAHVFKNFNGAIPYILDGGHCSLGIESTVVGFQANDTPVIYRHGAITKEMLEAVAGKVEEKTTAKETPGPGMLLHHYSPRTPFYLTNSIELDAADDPAKIGAICFTRPHPAIPLQQQFVLSPGASLEEAARQLYRAMHRLDEMQLDKIYAEQLPLEGIGLALNDRLQKAAYQYQNKKQEPIA